MTTEVPVNRQITLRLAVALVLACSTPAFPLDRTRELTQFRMSVWTSESGLPQNTVEAAVQTRDGYLWLATEEGLARFDGVRFVITDRETAPALRTSFISSLFEAPDGTLWIGTYGGGLARLRNGHIEAFHPELLETDRIRVMHATRDGVLFIATGGGGLLRIEGERVTRFTTRDGLPTNRLWAIEDDGAGGLWIGTHGGGVVRWRDSRVQQRITTAEGLPDDYARALLRDADGTLWIGTDGGGVAAFRGGVLQRTVTRRQGLPNDFVRTLMRDRDGTLWIGTDGGLARLRADRADALGAADGLPGAAIRAITEDREGNVWVGTTGGLVRLHDTRVLAVTRREGLPVDAVRAILEDGQSGAWLGTEGGGLCHAAAGAMRCFTTRDGLPNDTVYALIASNDGGMWVGTNGGGVAHFKDGKFAPAIDRRAGLPNDRISGLMETPNGDLWISTSAGLAIVRGGKVTRIAGFEDRQLRPLLRLPDGSVLVGTDGAGLWRVRADGTGATVVASTGRGSTPGQVLENDRIFTLTADAGGGGVWIGTSGGGLSRLDLASGAVRTLTRSSGLYDDVVFQVVDAGTGSDLWLTSNRGVYRVSRAKVLAAMNGTAADLVGTVYTTADGLPSNECLGAFPGAMRARDGRVWIATARGAAVIDPGALLRNPVPPPVHVEEVLIDGVLAATRPLRVGAGAQRLELRYTAVGLRNPEKVTFRYMLEGYDRDWVNAGTSRVAHYTKLAPDNYTFRVVATNEDGVSSLSEARLGVTVDPRWFETWWARLLALLLVAAAIWGALRLRLAALRARKNEELALAYGDVQRIAGELKETNRQLAVANVQLRALSYVDGLTGVANRRRFDEALEEVCAAAATDGSAVALLLIDLDHFKKLNDAHGHQSGDEALRIVGALLNERTQTRGGLAARFGGEEFVWLLPGVGLEAARAEAESLRLAIRDAAIPHDDAITRAGAADEGANDDDGSARLTASIGVSAGDGMRPGVAAPTPSSLLASADAALYRAKDRGRDCVESEPAAPASGVKMPIRKTAIANVP
jgi:diguanylate cyclase (GGDEF)-like protein